MLRQWVRRAETDAGERSGLTTDERVRVRELEREVKESFVGRTRSAGSSGGRNDLLVELGWCQVAEVLRGRPLRLRWMAVRSAAVCLARSVPFGKYWRSKPLVLSFEPRCRGECGSQK